MTFPEDIDKTEFLVHPVVPVGTTLEMLKGTPDYEMGLTMIEAFREGVTEADCEETGVYGYAMYPWMAADQHGMVS